jgi:hypothetical protein
LKGTPPRGGAGGVRCEMATKCVIIPSIATSMLPDKITLSFTKLTWSEFTDAIKRCDKIVNYVRHKPTNDLLLSIVKYEAGVEYRIDENDVIFMIGLKTRAPVPGADIAVTPNDLLIYLAKPA